MQKVLTLFLLAISLTQAFDISAGYNSTIVAGIEQAVFEWWETYESQLL